MFSTPRLNAAAAAFAIVAAVAAGSTGRAATTSEPPSKGRTMKLAALRTMSALVLTFALRDVGLWRRQVSADFAGSWALI